MDLEQQILARWQSLGGVDRYAKRWSESDHPRGKRGRFTKKIVVDTSVLTAYSGSIHRQVRDWALDNVRNKRITNRSTGWAIVVDKKGIKETASNHKDSAKGLLAIEELLEHSVLVESDAPKRVDNNLIRVHLFHHGNLEIDGDSYEAAIRVKEYVTTGKRFYNLHAIRKKDSPQIPAPSVSQRNREAGEPSDSSIDDDWERIKQGNDIYAAIAAGIERFRYQTPSRAQAEAGNYPMRHVSIRGLRISIETEKGQRRRPEWPPMPCAYGYIKGTVGKDKDHIDVFLANDTRSRKFSDLVVVIDQLNESGKFDEHKCILGAATEKEAVDCYKRAYTKGWRVGPVTTMTIEQFKAWLKLGDTQKRLHNQVSRYCARSTEDLSLAPMVDRYDWRQQPRAQAGQSDGGQWTKGGGSGSSGSSSGTSGGSKARSTRVREIAARPDTVKPGHSLHHSSLPSKWQGKLLDWSAAVREAMYPAMHSEVMAKNFGGNAQELEEQGWQQVDKDEVRNLLDQMNQLNQQAQAEGVQLHEFVNANGTIPTELAARLSGGERFFNPELLGNRLQSAAGQSTEDIESLASEMAKASTPGVKQLQAPDKKSTIAPIDYWMNKLSGRDPWTGAEIPQAQVPTQAQQSSSAEWHGDQLSGQARKRMDDVVQETVGDDPEMSEHFRSVLLDAWKDAKERAESHNDALRQVTGFFGKHHGALAANLSKGVDPSRIRGFDQLVDHAAREFPDLVSHIASESETSSAEEGLAKAIREGIRRVPRPYDPEVVSQATAMVGPSFFESIDDRDVAAALTDDSPIPFSVKWSIGRVLERYQRRSLLARIQNQARIRELTRQ